jgi:hypothetical protein
MLLVFGFSKMRSRWPPNGLTFSRKPREQTVSNSDCRCARLGGCNVLLGG